MKNQESLFTRNMFSTRFGVRNVIFFGFVSLKMKFLEFTIGTKVPFYILLNSILPLRALLEGHPGSQNHFHSRVKLFYNCSYFKSWKIVWQGLSRTTTLSQYSRGQTLIPLINSKLLLLFLVSIFDTISASSILPLGHSTELYSMTTKPTQW